MLCVFVAALLLPSCGQTLLLTGVYPGPTDQPVICPNMICPAGLNRTLDISYRVGKQSLVTVMLRDAAGTTHVLRRDVARVPSNEAYTLRWDGTVPGDAPGVVQRVLPDGVYQLSIQATAGGETTTQGGSIEVRNAASQLPLIQEARAAPAIVTPNEDALADVTTFSYRLPISATVSIAIQGPNEAIPFISDLAEGPYEQSHIWDGKRTDGSLLPSGLYTYTITARDPIGNIVQQRGPIEIQSPGRSEAQITYFNLAPTQVELGGIITATIKIKNTGEVPIRTHGPGTGYQYSTNQLFSSIENEQWASKGGGLWRVAIGWDGGPGYPFRWAMTPRSPAQWAEPGRIDLLMPGEEATIIGTIQIKERQQEMYFFAGLAHEGVGFPINRRGVTLVTVGF